MSSDEERQRTAGQDPAELQPAPESLAAPPPTYPQYAQAPRRLLTPLLLFLATCYTTYYVGGVAFAAPLLLTLLCHEFGHFLQAVRYRVPASLPYFIPMPFGPLGTMGAVIGMRGNMGDRKSLFDIGITGPLAGLVPAILFSVIGISTSEIVSIKEVAAAGEHSMQLGEPLIFQFLAYVFVRPMGPGETLMLNPIAYAGWVGIFITGLNLIPIGQLDGGHVLYALLRKRAHPIAVGLLLAAVAGVAWFGLWGWSLMLFLLALIGPEHPPTANDEVPLGTGRVILGWLSLLFVIIGFTPEPFIF